MCVGLTKLRVISVVIVIALVYIVSAVYAQNDVLFPKG